jgi:hypothetical protein
MRKISMLLLGVALIASEVGCASIAPPRIFDPGSAKMKQDRAVYFDPYPDNDAAPALDGGRPRDYNKPPAEVKRAWGADYFAPQRGPGRGF